MITHRAPYDYERPAPIVSQPAPLCTADGGRMIRRRDGLHCTLCDGTAYEMVMERDAADYRRRKLIVNDWGCMDETRGDLMRLVHVLRHPTPLEQVEADGERLAEFLAEMAALSDDSELGESPTETRSQLLP